MDAFIDLQGFRDLDKKFIPKEVAIISSDGNKLETLLIEPPEIYATLPSSVKKEVTYLEKHFHGLPWGSGFVNFEEFQLEVKRVLQCFDTVYVKGDEKRKVLSFLKNPIINLEKFGCPPLSELKKKKSAVQCMSHTIKSPACALENVLVLVDWYNEYVRDTESVTNNTESVECDSTCFCI